MKAYNGLILATILVFLSITALPSYAYEPLVGVKEGDWIEYNIGVTGTGSPPPTHDVRWMRIEVLPVQGTAFSINLTVRYANGTLGSAIWNFNFTEGNVEGWIIIPANLGLGEKFYDLSMHNRKPVNVTIQKEEQKLVLGATRTVTYGNDSFRHKEWDKATGVFVGSTETLNNVTNKDGWYIEDLTVTIEAIATNMWAFQNLPNHSGFSPLTTASIVLAILLPSSAIFLIAKNKARKFTARFLSQGKIAILTILMVAAFEIGTIMTFPFYDVGLSFAQINLIMQTIWTAMVLISMWLRTRAKYFVHEILMLIVISAWAIGFVSVLFMDPFSSSTEIFSNTPLRLIMNALHGIFSIPALLCGLWLVTLWRPESTTFAAKSKRIALLTTAFWIPSYVVGVLDFIVLHTSLFG